MKCIIHENCIIWFIFSFLLCSSFSVFANSNWICCRDLITLEVRVSLRLSGPCAILMIGNIMDYCRLKMWQYKTSSKQVVLHLGTDFYILFSNFGCRNRLLVCILNICKDIMGRLPKVVGIDVVEMALWAKVHYEFPLFYYFRRCLLWSSVIFMISSF